MDGFIEANSVDEDLRVLKELPFKNTIAFMRNFGKEIKC